jgi:hypothetical protein
MSLLDTGFVVVFTLLFPLYGILEYQVLLREIEQGAPNARLGAYRKTITVQWIITAILLALWFGRGRSSADLGIRWSNDWTGWAALLIAAGIVAGFEIQRRAIVRNEPLREQLRAATQSLAGLLPHTQRELNYFSLLSVTAGICEELLYRGFLIWYIQQIAGLNWAIVVSSLLFGYGHAYQGLSGFIKTAVAGLVSAGLYVFGGSILVPIVLHMAIDLLQGNMIFHALKDTEVQQDSLVDSKNIAIREQQQSE